MFSNDQEQSVRAQADISKVSVERRPGAGCWNQIGEAKTMPRHCIVKMQKTKDYLERSQNGRGSGGKIALPTEIQ